MTTLWEMANISSGGSKQSMVFRKIKFSAKSMAIGGLTDPANPHFTLR